MRSILRGAWTALAWLSLGVHVVNGETVVVPNVNEQQSGLSNNAYPFDQGDMRYQQVYAADQFQGLTGIVTQIAYRVDEQNGVPFISRPIDTEIRLSTTTAGPNNLSETFADNIGPDETLVFDKAVTLRSDGSGAFDIVFDVDKAYFYDGSGNLLVDIKVFGIARTTSFDSAGTGLGEGGTPWTDRVWALGVGSLTGTLAGDDGYVTQFTIEPGCQLTLSLAGPSAVGDGTAAGPRLRPGDALQWEVYLKHLGARTVHQAFRVWVEDQDGARTDLKQSDELTIHFRDEVRHADSLIVPRDAKPGTYRLFVGMGDMRQGLAVRSAAFMVMPTESGR
jgi:hypothetical protein